MPIPERLRPLPPTAEDMEFFTEVCRRIESGRYDDDDELAALLDRWNTRAGREYAEAEFRMYSTEMETDDFVRELLMGQPPFVADLTYAELRAVLEGVRSATIPKPEDWYFVRWLEENFTGGNISDLIYWPNDWFRDDALLHLELTHDQILAYAMAKSGRRLPDAPEDVPLPYPIPE
jgi:hypothetical protein